MRNPVFSVFIHMMIITLVSARKSRGHIIIIGGGGSGGGKQVEEKVVHVPVPIHIPCPLHKPQTIIQKVPYPVKVP